MLPHRRLADFQAAFDRNRAAFQNAPQLVFAEPAPEPPPAPGTLGALEESLRAAADRDLRSPARRRADDVWRRVSELVIQQHGRPLPTEIYDCEDAGQEGALRQARAAEEMFVQLAGAPGVSKASTSAAFDRFTASVAEFVGYVTQAWPSAADRAALEARRNDWSR